MIIFGYYLKRDSLIGVSCSLHFLKCRLSTKKGNPISLFFTGLVPSHNVLSLVILLSCVTSECLTMLFLSIGKFHIRYSTKSVSLSIWWMLYSPNHTTSIPRNLLLTFSHPHQLQFHACHNISLGSPIFQHSPFSHITKWTLAFAGDSDRYFILDWYVPPAVWWITIPVHVFFHALFLVVATLSLNGYMAIWLLIKTFLIANEFKDPIIIKNHILSYHSSRNWCNFIHSWSVFHLFELISVLIAPRNNMRLDVSTFDTILSWH